MKAAVFDTYVTKKNGRLMHFDIITKEGLALENVLKYGREYLNLKGEEGQVLSSKECSFCHIERALPEVESSILNKGYYILEMEGC